MKKHLALFALLMGAFTAYAQDFNKARMDSLFNLLATNKQAMGSIAMVKNGNLVYSNAIGYSNAATKTAATTTTVYRIGSVSKVFTAVMVFNL